jgi:hypothetical protein
MPHHFWYSAHTAHTAFVNWSMDVCCKTCGSYIDKSVFINNWHVHRHMDTCMYTWARACTHGHVHVHMGTCIHTWARVYTHGHVHTHMNTCTYTWARAYTYGHVHTHMGTCIHIWARAYTYGHVHIHIDCYQHMGRTYTRVWSWRNCAYIDTRVFVEKWPTHRQLVVHNVDCAYAYVDNCLIISIWSIHRDTYIVIDMWATSHTCRRMWVIHRNVCMSYIQTYVSHTYRRM